MKLVINLKLRLESEQRETLSRTLRTANAAADWISAESWKSKVFRQYDIHKALYQATRNRFGLSAQMTVRAISKVADAYKLDKKAKRTFKPLGAIAYDDRILSFKPDDHVSIWTVDGRRVYRFVCGDYQRALLPHRKGEVDLIARGGEFYLCCVCDVEEPPPGVPDDVLGVDLGVVNLATTSDGETFTGAGVERVRVRHKKLRTSLQQRADTMKNAGVRPKNVRRRLKRLGGAEGRYRKDVNHCISKKLVAIAEDTNRAIALEDLKGIRQRPRFGRKQRARMGGWAFYQLVAFVTYKARLAGVTVVNVDPRYTSQTCHECGHCERANRKTQAHFLCVACNHEANADVNGAMNIRAKVNWPKEPERHPSSGAAA